MSKVYKMTMVIEDEDKQLLCCISHSFSVEIVNDKYRVDSIEEKYKGFYFLGKSKVQTIFRCFKSIMDSIYE